MQEVLTFLLFIIIVILFVVPLMMAVRHYLDAAPREAEADLEALNEAPMTRGRRGREIR